jgi:hypothetical protein
LPTDPDGSRRCSFPIRRTTSRSGPVDRPVGNVKNSDPALLEAITLRPS